MNPSINGNVLKAADVFTGNWDRATVTFTPGGTPLNAVRVITRRADANGNPLATNFLRILGLWGLPFDRWNISVEAIAETYVPYCARDGLIANGIVKISSNNDFVHEICIYGREGVTIRQNNFFDYLDGVTVGMSDLADLDIAANGMEKNDGLAGALREGELWAYEVEMLPAIVAGLLDPNGVSSDGEANAKYVPDYVNTSDTGDYLPVITVPLTAQLDLTTAEEGRIYHVTCPPNKLLSLPSGVTMQNVVIIADCRISGGSGSTFTNMVLASTATGKGANPYDKAVVSLSANAVIGKADEDPLCDPGGGVLIYSYASVHTAAGTIINGTRIVARGDVDLTAGSDGLMGVAIQAGGAITMTSNNIMGLCADGVDGEVYARWYRLAR